MKDEIGSLLNPIRPGIFSRSTGPDAKNQSKHQPIEMKLGMSHYRHKSIPDAKFESGSSSRFGDMTSQIFPRKKGRVIKFGYLPSENGFNF